MAPLPAPRFAEVVAAGLSTEGLFAFCDMVRAGGRGSGALAMQGVAMCVDAEDARTCLEGLKCVARPDPRRRSAAQPGARARRTPRRVAAQ